MTPKQLLNQLLWPASSRPESKGNNAIVHSVASGDLILSHEKFEQLIDIAEAALIELGVKKEDRVVISAPNSPELGATILAAWRLNAMAVPVDARISLPEFKNVVQHLQAKVICRSSEQYPEFESEFAEFKEKGTALLDLAKLKTREHVAQNYSDTKIDALDLTLPSFLILTSGTTGIPKAAVHDLHSLAINMKELADMADIEPVTKALLPLPLSHIFGLEVFVILIAYGGSIIICEPGPKGFASALLKHPAEILVGVPVIYSALLALPQAKESLSIARILLCGGAPLPPSLGDEFKEKFGKRINNGYGSTESKIFALNLDGPFESVGKTVPSVKIEIMSEDNKPLPDKELGEITVAGEILMKGYLGQPDLTKKALHDGRYYTGDLGYLDNGYLYIQGRSKELIIVGGNKVFPSEVEDVLRQHPLVKEVAVVGPPHKQLGQIVKAVICVKEGDLSNKLNGSPEEVKEARQEMISQLKDYCKDNLKRELRPMDWDFQPANDPLPKTLSGKIDSKQLVHK